MNGRPTGIPVVSGVVKGHQHEAAVRFVEEEDGISAAFAPVVAGAGGDADEAPALVADDL